MLLALCCAVALSDTPATPLATTLREVSVHPGGALVTRHATLPAGDGRFVVAGLPASMDPESVRLRLEGAEANDVEVRGAQTAATAAPADDRLASLRARVDERAAARDAARDGGALERALRVRLEALLDQEAAAHATEVQGGHANATTWNANFSYLSEQLLAARKSERAATISLEEAEQSLAAAQAKLGMCAAQQAPRTFEVTFAVVALTGGAHELALDYQVAGASWSPRYDLRADAQLASVALTYRAEVVQQTGEDWRDVDVWLSTAEPRRGVVGPDAPAAWLDLASPIRLRGAAYGREAESEEHATKRWAALDDDHFASAVVERDALSVRYKLPRKETLASRPGATTVLLGHATLDVKGERVCTPSLDRDVWIRGRARNQSEWILLPGPAAVFFGNDFVGPAALELVRPEDEFTLHLGRDPGWVVTRTHVEDRAGSAGLFGSQREQADRWTIRVENQGALAGAADGSATVQVREVLETAHDDRIEVELDDCTPAPSKGGRFDRDRDEKGILTWEVTVARGSAATIDWTRLITWPEDESLQHGGGTLSFTRGGGARGGAGGTGGKSSSIARVPLAALVVAWSAALSLALLVAWRHRARRGAVATAAAALLLVASTTSNASAQQAVESRVAAVTVYGDGARVERHATLPGSGTWLVRDLPAGADPESIRVRVDHGEIVRVETRERRERHLPDAGLEALRRRVRDLAQELAALDDEGAAQDALAKHLAALLAPTAARPAGDAAARPDAKAWAEEQAFLATRLAAHQKATRDHARARIAKQRELEAAQQELQSGEAIDLVVRDVVVDAVAKQEGPLACVVSYLVQDAGWAPEYELRATRDLSAIELTYRARVHQQTDESWSDVELVLSTAAPRRGAAGPDPEAHPLTLQAPEPTGGGWKLGFASADAAPAEAAAEPELRGIAAPGAPPKPTRAPPFASVASEGISERFALPDRQTIEPRGEGQRVLIGRATLPLAIERWCVPAEDPTVWLRGKAKNTSPWTLLPGRTAVHVGADYLGRGTLALTPVGAEAQLHLGPDPWLAVERRELSDHLSTSGFSETGTRRHAYRIELKNLGAPGGAADGSVGVIVQESLPRARDERIEVALAKCTPRLSESGDDRRAREEKGLLTWRVAVARGAKATTIEWGWSADYPKELQLVTSRE